VIRDHFFPLKEVTFLMIKEVLHQYCNVTAQINLKCYLNAQGKKHFLVYYV